MDIDDLVNNRSGFHRINKLLAEIEEKLEQFPDSSYPPWTPSQKVLYSELNDERRLLWKEEAHNMLQIIGPYIHAAKDQELRDDQKKVEDKLQYYFRFRNRASMTPYRTLQTIKQAIYDELKRRSAK